MNKKDYILGYILPIIMAILALVVIGLCGQIIAYSFIKIIE